MEYGFCRTDSQMDGTWNMDCVGRIVEYGLYRTDGTWNMDWVERIVELNMDCVGRMEHGLWIV